MMRTFSVLSNKICLGCGETFTPKRKDAIACNPNCASLARSKKTLEYKKQWKKQNPAKVSIANAKHKAKRNFRHASWDKELNDFITEEAHHLRGLRDSATNIKWHVDHIIPLNGKKVSGLHVWNNLRVIPAIENLRKNNSFNF